jgi:penicillin-binding protein 1C
VQAERLRLLFPPPGGVLELSAVSLRVAGGVRPLTFLVDGEALPTDAARRSTTWQPPGPGRYRITVLDAEGAAAGATVQVRTP